jgi:hypothetical protein
MTPRRGALSGASLLSGAGAGRLHERRAPSHRRMQSFERTPLFLSYCPGTLLSVWRAASRLCVLPRKAAGHSKASPRSGLTFSLLSWRNGPAWQDGIACGESDSSFQFQVMSEGSHVERRTSCVLYIPRIPRDARYLQHAWQGFQPVHPTKEGTSPLCWILPLGSTGGHA